MNGQLLEKRICLAARFAWQKCRVEVALQGQFSKRVNRAVIANAPHPAVFQRLLYLDEHQRRSSQYMRGFRDPANDQLVREQGLTGLLLKEVKWDRPAQMEPEERAALLEDWQDRDAAFGMLNWYRASPVDVPPMEGTNPDSGESEQRHA